MPQLLLDAARRLGRFDGGQARAAYLRAIGAAMSAARLAAAGAR